MTEPERRALRAAISEERRRRIAVSCCAYCGEDLTGIKPYRPTRRFCSEMHRKLSWYRDTPQGRAYELAKRRAKRRAEGRPHRPWAEVPA